ncbi:phage tail assembly protein [Treponema primitia]|uniref:hypothetical protein n=1 Tax=Treponema primitia TaxID=88058 RepID=UPI00398135B6
MGKWTRQINEKDFVLSQESAENSIKELLDYYDVNIIAEEGTPDGKIVEGNFTELTLCYRRGIFENRMGEKGLDVIQKLKSGETLTYRSITGGDRKFMDRFGDGEPHTKAYSFMGRLCGLGEDGILKMDPRDLRAMERLFFIFLLVTA